MLSNFRRELVLTKLAGKIKQIAKIPHYLADNFSGVKLLGGPSTRPKLFARHSDITEALSSGHSARRTRKIMQDNIRRLAAGDTRKLDARLNKKMPSWAKPYMKASGGDYVIRKMPYDDSLRARLQMKMIGGSRPRPFTGNDLEDLLRGRMMTNLRRGAGRTPSSDPFDIEAAGLRLREAGEARKAFMGKANTLAQQAKKRLDAKKYTPYELASFKPSR